MVGDVDTADFALLLFLGEYQVYGHKGKCGSHFKSRETGVLDGYADMMSRHVGKRSGLCQQ
jgi:hypothetical protein